MTKLTNKHFAIFKAECRKWVKEFELSNWSVIYEFKKLDDMDACLARAENYNATISLDIEIDTNFDYDMTLDDYIKQCAKHEVLHLLLGRVSLIAKSNGYTNKDFAEEEESLVRKLIKIVK